MLIYLCGAIDQAKGLQEEWKLALQTELGNLFREEPPVLFDPFAAWRLTGRPVSRADAVRVIGTDLAVATSADWLVLYYQPGVESWGVPQELLQAVIDSVPVAVLWQCSLTPIQAWEQLRRSLVLTAQLDPDRLFTSVEALATYLYTQSAEAVAV